MPQSNEIVALVYPSLPFPFETFDLVNRRITRKGGVQVWRNDRGSVLIKVYGKKCLM